VPIEAVRAGDIVFIQPAAEIPADGVVVQGRSTVDQSSITGESKPVEKVPGAAVLAATTNHTGTLDVRTERVGRNTIFGKIINAVEKAEHSRAPIQKLAERLAGWLVYLERDKAGMSKVHQNRKRISLLRIEANSGGCTQSITRGSLLNLEKAGETSSYLASKPASTEYSERRKFNRSCAGWG
jgi:hypothetical protein